MPIPIKDLKEAQKPLEDRILEFLKANSDKAYDISEIIRNIEGYKDDMVFVIKVMTDSYTKGGWFNKLKEKYSQALQSLINRNLINSANVRDNIYFGIKR